MPKSHTEIQSLNIVAIDKPIEFLKGYQDTLEEEENDIEENDIEENVKTWTISLNKVTKFHISPIFINFHIHLTDSGSLPRKYG